jgi:hypothetical protein
MTYYTIYKITNQIDGKFYIGSHKTKNLNDNYMGSGKYLKRAQEKYGIENFTKEILFVFETAEEMYVKEAEVVNEDFLATENTYNLKIGGFGGFDYINVLKINSKNGLHNWKNNPKFLDQMKKPPSSNTIDGLEKYKKINGSSAGFFGKKHNDITKQKISEKAKLRLGNKNSQYGTIWITNGKQNKKIKKHEIIPENWFRGRV